MLFLGELGLGLGFLQLGLERLDFVARQDAGVVAVLVVLFIGGGEERGQFGEAQALLLHLGEHLGKLALEDVVVRDQLRPPAAGGDGLEVGLEIVDVAREVRRGSGDR